MISIIGAGPAGSYLGYLLAKNNKDVSIFEEHSKIGLPVQCTGIVTSSIKDIIKLKKDIITNEIGKARIFSPNNRFTEIKLKNKNIIIDREKFDSYIADMALRQGAKIFLNHRFIENKKNVAIIKDKTNSKTKKIRFDKLIGADGPLSPVAKSNNLLGKRRFWHGIQARAKIKNENIVEFYPYFGTFAWVVPENKETVRVGLISNRYTNVLFRNFLKLKDITNNKIIDYQSGLIPVYNPKTKTAKNNIYLLGDAALQVKATTGGGIIQGLTAAKALSDSIIKNRNYEKEWRKLIAKDLWLHLKARNIMDKFSLRDWNKLIYMFNNEKTKNILENYDRDYISKFLFKLIFTNPKLLYFLKYSGGTK